MKNPIRWQSNTDDGVKYFWCWDDDDGSEVRVECDIHGWIHIDALLPPEKIRVLHCCYVDKHSGYTYPEISQWLGRWTSGNAIVMENEEIDDDFYPCDRWQFVILPPEPE